MTYVRLGYVAMSVHLENCSPSQTMTYANFKKMNDRSAAIDKLERIANSNLENCLRLLKHNVGSDISFFRFSSKLVPLANHEDLSDWKYMRAIKDKLNEIAEFLQKHAMRIDFHPDHFVVLNSSKADVLNQAILTLSMHEALLKGMNLDPIHRCVLHVGGGYNDKEKALEQFIHNWGLVPYPIQKMIMLENDDKVFTVLDTLYLCEKLSIPFVFDYHHHLANSDGCEWEKEWERMANTWKFSIFPMKMHISSPKGSGNFRAHANYIDVNMFLDFLNAIKGTVPKLDCMIEAKMKDDALFRLMSDLKAHPQIEVVDGASFLIK